MGDSAGISVTVSPAQAAFFAGEEFSVTITFTNLNEPSTSYAHQFAASPKPALGPPPIPYSAAPSTTTFSSAKSHRKSAHSVAWGTNGPPKTPQTAVGFMNVQTPGTPLPIASSVNPNTDTVGNPVSLPLRRGFIGKGKQKEGANSGPSTQAIESNAITILKKKHTAKSLSVSALSSSSGEPLVSPLARLPKLDTGQSDSPLIDYKRVASAGTPPPQRASLPIPKSHPHARKQSEFEGQSLVEDVPSAPSPSVRSPLSRGPPLSAGANGSPFTIPLDSINENATPIPYASPLGMNTPVPVQEDDAGRVGSDPPSFRNDIFTGAVPPPPRGSSKPTLNGGYRGTHARRRSSLQYPPLPPPTSSSSNAPPRIASPLPIDESSSPFPFPSSHPSQPNNPYRRTTFTQAFAPQGTETLLYAYARLVGTLELDESIVPRAEVESLRARLRAAGKSAIGGGRMDIASGSPSANVETGGTASPGLGLLGSLFRSPVLGGGGGNGGSDSSTPGYLASLFGSPGGGLGRSRSLSISGRYGSGSGPSGGGSSGMFGGAGGEDPRLLPTLELQPSILAVDLSLKPGESRSYKYTLPLPASLPPSYRGTALKFTYTLVLGTSRVSAGTNLSTVSLPNGNAATDGGMRARSRVVRVPVRVYGHASVVQPHSRPYDLLWPVGRRRELQRSRDASAMAGKVEDLDAPKAKKAPLPPPPRRNPSLPPPADSLADSKLPFTPSEALQDLQSYGSSLLPSSSSHLSHTNGNGTDVMHNRPPPLGLDSDDNIMLAGGDDMEGAMRGMGCREAVEVITRNPKRMSYDIEKDGAKVAVLTFVKSAYRLGETILGVVDLNFAGGMTKVMKLSATLEAHESLPPTIPLHFPSSSTRPQSSLSNLKRIHSSFQTTSAQDSQRIAFALDIPADGTPAFGVTAYDPLEGAGGVVWKVRMCFLVAVAPSPRDVTSGGEARWDDDRVTTLVRDGPRGEWASSRKASESLAPQGRVSTEAQLQSHLSSLSPRSTSGGWTSMLFGSGGDSASSSMASSQVSLVDQNGDIDDGDERHDRESKDRWVPLALETVECEVPVSVWPGSTVFRPRESVFDC